MKYALVALAVLFGLAAIVFGGYDDSPGLQGIGLLVIIAAVVLGVRAARRSA